VGCGRLMGDYEKALKK